MEMKWGFFCVPDVLVTFAQRLASPKAKKETVKFIS